MKPITYLSNQSEDYIAALGKCKTLPDLQALLHEYRTIFPDALAAAPKNEDEFEEFQRGLRKERRRRFAGDEFANRYGAVLMPEIAVRVSMVAMQFHVPWGTAFIRLQDAGRIVFCDGIATWKE